MRLAVASLALVLVTACSAVVDPDDMRLPCVLSGDGWDPCPVGLVCEDSYCVRQACAPEDERCDGSDNDCDGRVDEGHDLDEDGFTWCGGGVMALADCDDSQPAAHPADSGRSIAAVPETCDGLDNDCNGMADDGDLCPAGKECIERTCVNPTDCTLLGNECRSGEVCDTTAVPPHCVPGDDCRVAGATCPSMSICDRTTGNCVVQHPVGSPCATDAECDAGYCALRDALGLGGDGRICAVACCSDGDCPAGSVCFAPGNGAKLCADPGLVGLQPGSSPALASCGADDECRSGMCQSGQCLANCAAHADCGTGSCSLILRNADSAVVDVCRGGTGGGETGDFCTEGNECRFGLCYTAFGAGVCSGPCGTTADCPGDFYCGWEIFDDSHVQVCVPSTPWGGDGSAGASCGANADCRDLACVSGQCWDTCCNDADCGGRRCKAVRFGTGEFQMHCDPR